MVFLNFFFEKVNFENKKQSLNNQQTTEKEEIPLHAKRYSQTFLKQVV